MMRNLTLWMLGGAFVASAVTNVVQWTAPPATAATAVTTPPPLCCEALGLDPAQIDALTAACGSCCADSEALGRQIVAKVAELEAALQRSDVEPAELHRIGAELGALRMAALHTAIDGILEVRGILAPEQVEALRRALAAGS